MHRPDSSSSNNDDSASDLDIDIMVTDPDGLILSPFSSPETDTEIIQPNSIISPIWRMLDLVTKTVNQMFAGLLSLAGGVVNMIPRALEATYNWWKTPDVPTELMKPTTKKIFLLGDQHAVDLAVAISESRYERKDGYKLIDRTELNNECYQILEEVNKLSQRDSTDDIFIIYFGANDKYVQHIYEEVKNMLDKLQKFKLVLLIKVQYNAHEKTDMINQNLKAIAVDYSNCVFVDIDADHDFTNEEFSNSKFIKSLSEKINQEIDAVLAT